MRINDPKPTRDCGCGPYLMCQSHAEVHDTWVDRGAGADAWEAMARVPHCRRCGLILDSDRPFCNVCDPERRVKA